jgi:hypothetical protein
VEKLAADGFNVKVYDLKLVLSAELNLVRKPNKQLTMVPFENAPLFRDDFRGLIYDLAYASQETGKNILLSSIEAGQNKLQMEGKSKSKVFSELYSQEIKTPVTKVNQRKELTDFALEAICKSEFVSDQAKKAAVIDEWRGTSDNGLLLYRDTVELRCLLNSDVEESQRAMATFYLKDGIVNIEVFLYDGRNMSITSSVTAVELFGEEPSTVCFADRIKHLSNMLDRLYIIQENNTFHMKVEAEAEPMSAILRRKRASLESESPQKRKDG